MIIAVFGVQRSGKTTFLSLLNKICDDDGISFKYIKAYPEVTGIAESVFGKIISECNKEEAEKVYEIFHEKLHDLEKTYDIVACDMHFGFYNNEMTELYNLYYDRLFICFDVIYYLKTDPDVIIERIRKTKKEAVYSNYNNEQIVLWQNFELNGLKRITELLKKNVIVIHDACNYFQDKCGFDVLGKKTN